ncbi:MAG: sugar ABC transporter ATP-binding protein [Kiritimatiellae bacterium]|nr:sugar ABC transporter ATP-binding protein [Kiritimatiellia bacterium]MDD5520981.1 sugar ABC transporter ATP-binding protein [Kiritimatiellia bacterium]
MTTEKPQRGEIVLKAANIHKAFAGVQALAGVSLEIRSGEVHALMGENGAGKSTLMNVLAGLYQPDAGEIQLRGENVVIKNPHDAICKGIAMIHQELMPIPDMTVAENILLGWEPVTGRAGWINRRAMKQEAERLLGLLGMKLPVTRTMGELSVAEMQTVEIARAIGHNAGIVIMDEPTSAISDREVEALFAVIRMLTQRGVAIVYISHKMDEIFRIADTVTVLRDGIYVGTHPIGELNEQKLIALMVGRDLAAMMPKDHGKHGGTALDVRRLGKTGKFREVSFNVQCGEVLGVAGLMGAGRTEVMNALFGLDPADEGEILVNNQPTHIRRPADAMSLGIGMVTEDRKGYGIVPTMSVEHNTTLAALDCCCVGPFLVHARERAVADENIMAFGIKTTGRQQAVNQLSGGNQQKVVIAKTLLARPSIVILDEPTRGIDIGAKAEVYAIIARLASEGKAVILVSSELPEILSLSDRVLVMRQGTVAAELDPRHTTQEEILKHAMPI